MSCSYDTPSFNNEEQSQVALYAHRREAELKIAGRRVSKVKGRRFCRRKIRKANPEFCSHPLPRRYQPLPVLHPQLRYPLSSCGSSLRYSRSPFYPSPDAQVQIFLFPFYAQIAPAGQRGSDAGSSASRERVEDPCSVPG